MRRSVSKKREDPDPAEFNPYDEIADLVTVARQIAKLHADEFLTILLDMVLIELAKRSAP